MTCPAGVKGRGAALNQLFRHRFLHTLCEAKLISPRKLDQLRAWKHSGFNIDNGGEEPIAPDDIAGRERLAQYILRHPFSLQKITWNSTTKTVIYRSKRHHNIKRNFQIFKAPDFIAAAIDHLPPKGQQTVRYYGIYSNKSRGMSPYHGARVCNSHQPKPLTETPRSIQILLIPAPPRRRARDMRPLWRDLILKVWGGDPLQCPCCKGTMKPVRTILRREEIEFLLRLHGLWEGIFPVHLRRPLILKPWSPSSHLGKQSRNGSPITNLISLGSIRKGNLQGMIPDSITKASLGNQPKSRSAMAAPWFSIRHKHRLHPHSKIPAAKNLFGTAGKGTTFAFNVN